MDKGAFGAEPIALPPHGMSFHQTSSPLHFQRLSTLVELPNMICPSYTDSAWVDSIRTSSSSNSCSLFRTSNRGYRESKGPGISETVGFQSSRALEDYNCRRTEKGKCDESDVVLARSQSHQFFSATVYSTALRVERRVAGGIGFRDIRQP